MIERIEWRSENTEALVGIVVVDGVKVGSSPAWLVERLAAARPIVDAEARDRAVRAMLRLGGFRPAGRNRPAQEFLARAAVPSISSAVDVNNLVSQTYRLPASVIDGALCASGIVIREGRAGERYVFNRSGQDLDLEGLLVLCDASGVPLASPVKDSFVAHVTPQTRTVVFCAYGARGVVSAEEMGVVMDSFVALLTEASGGNPDRGWVASLHEVRPWAFRLTTPPVVPSR